MSSKHYSSLCSIVDLSSANNSLGIGNTGSREKMRTAAQWFGEVRTMFRVKMTDSSNAIASYTVDRGC